MGVQSFSKPALTQVIFSANRFHANHVSGMLSALQIPFDHLVGCYKGVVENSWIIGEEHLHYVKPLLIGEESILLLANPNSRSQYRATLIFLDGAPSLDLGYMRDVPESEAKAQDAWTYRLIHQNNGVALPYYFVCYHNDKFGEPIKG
jgi:hypothetical protein